MTRIILACVAACAIVAPASAEQLSPMQARSISLGEVNGVAYFTAGSDGYEVVATLQAGDQGIPMRFMATLASGQKMLVSVPRATSQAAYDLQIAREGDAIFVTDAASMMN